MSRSPFRALNKVDELYAPSNHDAEVNLFQPTKRSFSRNPTRLDNRTCTENLANIAARHHRSQTSSGGAQPWRVLRRDFPRHKVCRSGGKRPAKMAVAGVVENAHQIAAADARHHVRQHRPQPAPWRDP